MGGAPRPPMGAGPSGPDPGGYRQPRGGDGNRNFGPNKPPKGRGGSNFAKNRNQEGKAKGPLKELRSGRMFSVDEDSRFQDEEDLKMVDDVVVEDPLVEDVELNARDEDDE
jgi:hypothetical protein